MLGCCRGLLFFILLAAPHLHDVSHQKEEEEEMPLTDLVDGCSLPFIGIDLGNLQDAEAAVMKAMLEQRDHAVLDTSRAIGNEEEIAHTAQAQTNDGHQGLR